jgi:hypothetical protein
MAEAIAIFSKATRLHAALKRYEVSHIWGAQPTLKTGFGNRFHIHGIHIDLLKPGKSLLCTLESADEFDQND